MIVLLHSSKGMRADPRPELRAPQLLPQARQLAGYLQACTPTELAAMMKISAGLAETTQALMADWSDDPAAQTPAIEAFIGDIYSGFQAPTLSAAERQQAEQHLRILSGLYGLLRPMDGIRPYRLEMGYKLPGFVAPNLYKFWGEQIAALLPADGPILNLAAKEYTDVVTPYLAAERLIAPKFLTVSPKTGQPGFVTVHAKIARGAFARWAISQQVHDAADLRAFDEIGYRYDEGLSDENAPAFVCQEFGGLGLSIRLQDKG